MLSCPKRNHRREFRRTSRSCHVRLDEALDDLEGRMTSVHVEPREIMTLQLDHVADSRQRFSDAYDAIIEGSAFVNWRRIERGFPPVLVLSFYA